MPTASQISTLRNEIGILTRQIFDLVAKRMSLAKEISERKREHDVPVIDRGVERALQDEVLETCRQVSLESDFGLRLLNILITESVRVQQEQCADSSLPTVTEIFSRAKAIERSGNEVLHLEVGEPDFGPPTAVKTALNNALASGQAGYTEPIGIPSLREKIAEIFSKEYKSEIGPGNVIITVGGKLAVYLGVSSVVRPGDEVIVIEPSYPAYSEFVEELGGRVVFISSTLEDSWTPDLEDVKNSINHTTKGIIINSPSNPTGKILSEETFGEIAELAIDSGIFVISDEVYSKFAENRQTSIIEHSECNHIAVQSFSKSHGMTGFRLGFAISDSETITSMAKLQSLLLTCAPEFIQYAGIAALDCIEDVERNALRIQSRRELMTDLLRNLPLRFHPPDGGFYVFPQLPDEESGQEFAERLLLETGVCVVPGAVYGRPYQSFFRIALCQNENILEEAVRRIGDVLG